MAKLLDLDALTDRLTVKVGGQVFTLLSPDELSPLQSHRVGRLGTRMSELSGQATLTEAEEAELDTAPAAICKVLVVEGNVDALDANQRWQLALTFIRPRAVETAPFVATPPAVLAEAPTTVN